MHGPSSPLRCFTSKDAPPGGLQGERIAVLGYGNLGRAFALNLRDSAADRLVVGNIEDGYAAQARAEGLTVLSIGAAVAQADVVLVLLPDEVIPEAFAGEIAAHLVPSAALVFASGYALAYRLIDVPPGVDALMLAPRMAGETARQRFLQGRGFHAFASVEQDASGRAWQRLLALADAVGVLREGVVELDARSEAHLDLLVEQTLGAAIGTAIMQVFALGVEAGLPPEALVLEMYMSEEMEMVFRAFREQGFFHASATHGPTALFGGCLRTMELLGSSLGETFQRTFEEIRSGEFVRKFLAERKAGYPLLKLAESMRSEGNPQSEAELRMRALLNHGATAAEPTRS